ncbi:DNA-methyltransferase [Rothia dentocariosa]|jgi:nheIM
MKSWKIINDDALAGLSQVDDNSIQLTVTSPPYYRLRSYSGCDNEIGWEESVGEYVDRLCNVFKILLKKTAPEGVLFLNLGDSYVEGQLAGVPWRVAIALQDVGWILRSDIIWHKPNAMPSSVKNRPTPDHEYIFMFAKSKHYKYNQDSIREPHVTFSENSKMRGGRGHFGKRGGTPEKGKNQGNSNLHDARWDQAFHPFGRNKRTVWNIPLGKFRGAHFAVFPESLVEICIKAGSDIDDIVCDPFAGSGTTGVVALKLGRRFIGVELFSEYCTLAEDRLRSYKGHTETLF